MPGEHSYKHGHDRQREAEWGLGGEHVGCFMTSCAMVRRMVAVVALAVAFCVRTRLSAHHALHRRAASALRINEHN